MARSIATNTAVDRDALLEFVRPRHRMVLVTPAPTAAAAVAGQPAGSTTEGRIVISTYPERAKVANLRRDPAASVLVLSDEWNGPWVQVDGTAEVLDLPDALEPLVDYFRCHLRRAPRLGRVPRRRWSPGQVADPGHARALGPGRHRRLPGPARRLTLLIGEW